MEEIWKDIEGWEGKYQVSNYGSIRNNKGHVLSPGNNGSGYLFVSLWRNNKPHQYYIHRLVWEAFNGPIPEGMEINHNDECTTNNTLSNLSAMSHKMNANYGTRNIRSASARKGMNRNRYDESKWVIKLSKDNEILHFYPSLKQAERETGISHQSISHCCRGKYNTAGGFIWQYAS